MTHRTPSDILDSIRPGMADRLREAGACAAKPNRADASSGVGTAARSAGMARNRVLALLKDGRPDTSSGIAKRLDLPRAMVREVLRAMSVEGVVARQMIDGVTIYEVPR